MPTEHTEHTDPKPADKPADKGPSDKDQLAALVELHADELDKLQAAKAAEKAAEAEASEKSGQ